MENRISAHLMRAVEIRGDAAYLDASNLYYKDLNKIMRHLGNPEKTIHIMNVYGQRYIGTDLDREMEMHIHGTPGNDLAAFMDGPVIYVHGNAQDGVGNTMNGGKVIVHGRAGDIVGHSMRGGEIYVRDDVGYRCGIHMKEYMERRPTLVVGGTAQDYLGEYMAGGILVVLGLTLGEDLVHKAKFIGTGMHGGIIYLRGRARSLGKEVDAVPMKEQDHARVQSIIDSFRKYFGLEKELPTSDFTKLVPVSKRPYGMLYVQ
jgi:glutamate synthase domain-containing protein 3